MSSVTLRRNGRRVAAVSLVALLAASFLLNVQLAVLFAPLLVMLSLLGSDPAVEAAIVSFVHRLKRPGNAARAARAATRSPWVAPTLMQISTSPLGSRAPPLVAA